ncbi:Tex-like N-terminal domain-containing protein, partial [Acinetobacter baumannii]
MVDNRQALMKMLVKELGFTEKQVRHVIQLTEEGNTVPFIARYRKEWTGSLDEVQIRTILERWQYMMQLEDRKEEVLRLIDEKGKLTEEL